MAYTTIDGKLVKLHRGYQPNGKRTDGYAVAVNQAIKAKRRNPTVKGSSTPTLDRIKAILDERKEILSSDRGFGSSHERMYALADKARKHGLKGRWNLLCNRTQCLSDGATWYNRGSHAFYCEDCARMLNDDNARDPWLEGKPLCREVTQEEAATLHVSSS